MVGLTQGLDHGLADSDIRLHTFTFLRNVRNKNIEDPAVGLSLRIVAVIIHPADSTVLADDPVFHVIHTFFIGAHLPGYCCGHLIIIIRMDHPFESIAGQCLKIIQILTSESTDHFIVDIKELFIAAGLVDKEAAGHMSADLLYDR